MADGETTGLDEVADDLYGRLPREFTSARDAEVKRLRADGQKELARDVAALRKPTVTAWLANQLVRQHPDELGPLLDLGAALREASAALSGPELRELSRQRGQLVQALVRQARRLAADAGQAVSEDAARGLEETLHAALADEHAGELLRAGRLTEGLRHGGFGPLSTSAAPPAPAAKRTTARRRTTAQPSEEEQRRAERRAELEQELSGAWAAARAAADSRADAEGTADAADKAAADARRTVDRLRAELTAAETALGQAEQAQEQASAAREAARAEAEQATRRVSELQRALDRS